MTIQLLRYTEGLLPPTKIEKISLSLKVSPPPPAAKKKVRCFLGFLRKLSYICFDYRKPEAFDQLRSQNNVFKSRNFDITTGVRWDDGNILVNQPDESVGHLLTTLLMIMDAITVQWFSEVNTPQPTPPDAYMGFERRFFERWVNVPPTP